MDSANLRKTALILYMLVVFILHVSTDTQGVKVPRGTVHKAFINKPFKISCNLTHCDEQTINVTWTKENTKRWIPISGADHMSASQNYSSSDPNMLTSYLTFTNISKHHEGSYRCELLLPQFSMYSHHINVSVSVTVERENTDNSSGSWWLPYLFICFGVLILILTVMLISVLCINGFKSNNTCNLTLQPGQSTSHVSDCSDDPLSNRKDSTSFQVVYASLHHLAPTPSSTRSHQTQEEFSEYASIRVS
uniref:Si:ch211-214p13.8 n=1 Tax=Cyprinus carpio carpio TaxID=630221 RepID=A0A9J8BAR3_CYPCA